jgi:IS30 family transposase
MQDTNREPEEVKAYNMKLTDREKLETLKELHETPIGGHTEMDRNRSTVGREWRRILLHAGWYA